MILKGCNNGFGFGVWFVKLRISVCQDKMCIHDTIKMENRKPISSINPNVYWEYIQVQFFILKRDLYWREWH